MIIYGSYTGHFDRPDGALLDVDIFGSEDDLHVLVSTLGLKVTPIAGTERFACHRIGRPVGWRFIDFQVCTPAFIAALEASEPMHSIDFEGVSVRMASKNLCCLIKRIALEELPFPNEKHQVDLEGYDFGDLTPAQIHLWELFAADIKRVDAYLRSPPPAE